MEKCAAAEGDDKRRGKNLKIVSDDPVKGAVIAGLSETAVEHATALLEVIRSGESARAYGSTEMNDKSSRSHTICKLSIDSEETFEGEGDAAVRAPRATAQARARIRATSACRVASSTACRLAPA